MCVFVCVYVRMCVSMRDRLLVCLNKVTNFRKIYSLTPAVCRFCLLWKLVNPISRADTWWIHSEKMTTSKTRSDGICFEFPYWNKAQTITTHLRLIPDVTVIRLTITVYTGYRILTIKIFSAIQIEKFRVIYLTTNLKICYAWMMLYIFHLSTLRDALLCCGNKTESILDGRKPYPDNIDNGHTQSAPYIEYGRQVPWLSRIVVQNRWDLINISLWNKMHFFQKSEIKCSTLSAVDFTPNTYEKHS